MNQFTKRDIGLKTPLIAFLVFCAGAVIGGKNELFLPIVTLEITNNTHTLIKKIEVSCSTVSVEILMTKRDVPPGKTIVLKAFVPSRELDYIIYTTLDNGRSLGVIKDYVSTGYHQVSIR